MKQERTITIVIDMEKNGNTTQFERGVFIFPRADIVQYGPGCHVREEAEARACSDAIGDMGHADGNSFGLDSLRPRPPNTSKRPEQERPSHPRLCSATPVCKRVIDICIGNQLPDSALPNAILGFGADPSQRYQDTSIWALFLCYIADHFQAETPDSTFIEEATYFEALKIQNGAGVLLPRNWLSDSAYVNAFNAFGGDNRLDEVSDERLWRRFPNTAPVIQESMRKNTFYAVSDLLERFRDRFGVTVGHAEYFDTVGSSTLGFCALQPSCEL